MYDLINTSDNTEDFYTSLGKVIGKLIYEILIYKRKTDWIFI